VNTRSPGYEVNDIAFQSRADFIGFIGNVSRLFNKPTRLYQCVFLTVGGQYQRNYQGLSVPTQQLHFSFNGLTPQFWSFGGYLIARPSVLDDRLLRGGPSVRAPANHAFNAGLTTDVRKRVNASLGVALSGSGIGDDNRSAGLTVSARPRPNVQLSIAPSIQSSHNELQYVTSVADATLPAFAGRRYVLADIEQTTTFVETRASVTLSPTLSVEVFAQPFIAAGRYTDYKEFRAPRSSAVFVYGRDGGTIASSGSPASYTIDPDGTGPAASFTLTSPDFNQRSLRGNAVVRWEYRPGSTIYLVWTQSRSHSINDGSFDLDRDAAALFSTKPDNIFLLKASWWLSR
jgi:hypothetical protein